MIIFRAKYLVCFEILTAENQRSGSYWHVVRCVITFSLFYVLVDFFSIMKKSRMIRLSDLFRSSCVAFSVSVLDKEDSSEEMSVPGSPHNEAIQHSSVSTSNGVSSSTTSSSATGPTTDQSTEGEESSAASATRSQPAKSWSGSSRFLLFPAAMWTWGGKRSLAVLQSMMMKNMHHRVCFISPSKHSSWKCPEDARDDTLPLYQRCTKCLKVMSLASR